MTNLAQMRDAAKASPFYGIKSSLPLLERLELRSPDYLIISDSLAIIHMSPVSPRLEIRGDNHFYTFQKVDEEGCEEREPMTREERKETEKLFKELFMYHYVKKSYTTRP